MDGWKKPGGGRGTCIGIRLTLVSLMSSSGLMLAVGESDSEGSR